MKRISITAKMYIIAIATGDFSENSRSPKYRQIFLNNDQSVFVGDNSGRKIDFMIRISRHLSTQWLLVIRYWISLMWHFDFGQPNCKLWPNFPYSLHFLYHSITIILTIWFKLWAIIELKALPGTFLEI